MSFVTLSVRPGKGVTSVRPYTLLSSGTHKYTSGGFHLDVSCTVVVLT